MRGPPIQEQASGDYRKQRDYHDAEERVQSEDNAIQPTDQNEGISKD
jgi:hypothetical protein